MPYGKPKRDFPELYKKKNNVLELVNISGQPVDLKDWTVGHKKIALNMAIWLSEHNCAVAISWTDDGVIVLDYAYNGKIQPPLRVGVNANSVIWPKGSDFDLMMMFLSVA